MDLVFAVLGTLSIVVVTIKGFQLYFMHSEEQKTEADSILLKLKESTNSFKTYCEEVNQPISKIALAASKFKSMDKQMASMNEILVGYQKSYQKGIGLLALFGNLATVSGLVGTLVGLITGAASTGDKEVLQQAISNSLNSVALGLAIGIPSLVFYAILSNRANVLTQDLNKGSLKIFVAMNPE